MSLFVVNFKSFLGYFHTNYKGGPKLFRTAVRRVKAQSPGPCHTNISTGPIHTVLPKVLSSNENT